MAESGMKKYAFPKIERLKDEKRFKALFQRGLRLRGRLMMLACVQTDQPGRRAGIVAGKRVGNSVIRNRAKRLLREAYRMEKHRLDTHCDLALVASPNIRNAELADVRAEVARLLEKAVERLDTR